MSTDKRLQTLTKYLETVGPEEAARQLDKTKGNPEAIFELIQQGDVVGVAIAMQNGIKPDITDENGMTPSHHAAAKDAQLINRVLSGYVSGAPLMRDDQNRLPLDTAREAGHDELGNVLQEITYPELFQDQPETNLPSDLIKAYAEKNHQLEQTSTAPPVETITKVQSIEQTIKARKQQDRSRDH